MGDGGLLRNAETLGVCYVLRRVKLRSIGHDLARVTSKLCLGEFEGLLGLLNLIFQNTLVYALDLIPAYQRGTALLLLLLSVLTRARGMLLYHRHQLLPILGHLVGVLCPRLSRRAG